MCPARIRSPQRRTLRVPETASRRGRPRDPCPKAAYKFRRLESSAQECPRLRPHQTARQGGCAWPTVARPKGESTFSNPPACETLNCPVRLGLLDFSPMPSIIREVAETFSTLAQGFSV